MSALSPRNRQKRCGHPYILYEPNSGVFYTEKKYPVLSIRILAVSGRLLVMELAVGLTNEQTFPPNTITALNVPTSFIFIIFFWFASICLHFGFTLVHG